MDQGRLTLPLPPWRWAILPCLGLLLLAAALAPTGSVRWTWTATALAWFAASLLTWRTPPVAALAALVGLCWVAAILLGHGVLWHRAPIIHLLLAGGLWRPMSWTARVVVVGGYVLSALPSGWAQPAVATAAGAAIVAAGAAERMGRSVSLVRRPPWQAATVLAAVAFAVPPVLAVAGVGRAWAMPVLITYDLGLVVVATLVVAAVRPWARPRAVDLAVELGEPAADLHAALVPRLGDPDVIGREAAAAAEAAAELRARLDDRQAELRRALAETQASWQRLTDADDLARRNLLERLDALTGDRLADAIAELAADATLAFSPAAGAAQRARLHLLHAQDELDALGRGLLPAVLADGLVPALRQLANASAVPVRLRVPEDCGCSALPSALTATAYFAAAEAVTNAIKHASATEISIDLSTTSAGLEIAVVDDGVGGVGSPAPGPRSAGARGGMGLDALRDRVAEAGGRLVVTSPVGAGTSLRVVLPVDHE